MRKLSVGAIAVLIGCAMFGVIAALKMWWTLALTMLFLVLLLNALILVLTTYHGVKSTRKYKRSIDNKIELTNKRLTSIATAVKGLSLKERLAVEEKMHYRIDVLERNIGHQLEEALRTQRMSLEAMKNEINFQLQSPTKD